MKNRIKKKNLDWRCKLPRQFVKDTLRALAEAKAGKLSPYNFSKRSKRRLGALKGKIKIADDFDAYITLDDLTDAAANLAKQHGVSYVKTGSDALADVITRLAGDDVVTDETEDLIIALRRANVIDGPTMVSLLGRYLDEKRHV